MNCCAGVLEEVTAVETNGSRSSVGSRLGRPGRLLRLDTRRPRFLTIQFGVVHTRLAMLPVAAVEHDRWTVTFRTPASPVHWLSGLKKAAATLAASIPKGRDPIGAIISIPGVVDENTGAILYGPNLHWMESAKLPQLIQQVWPVPVCFSQEIHALALGHLAIEKPGEDFLLVDFGHGVGGAAVVGGSFIPPRCP